MPPKPDKITKTKAKAIGKKLKKHFGKAKDAGMLAAVDNATDRAEVTAAVLDDLGVNLNDYDVL